MDESVSASDRETELQRQNEELRRVIHGMRRDIETLGNEMPAATAMDDQIPVLTNSSSAVTANNGV